MSFRTMFTASVIIVAASGLAGCSEDLAETAQKNGCPQLEHRIERLFVTAGLYNEAKRDEEANRSSNLQRALDGMQGVTSQYSKASFDVVRHFYENAPRADSPFLSVRDDYGSMLAQSVAAIPEAAEDDVQFDFFGKCETYVSQSMADADYLGKLELLFASPHIWKQ